MSVTVRTNHATNPAAATAVTNYADIDGTGGTAAIAHETGDGYLRAGFARVTWSVATSSVSGGVSYTEPSGLDAATDYALQIWVYSSRAQTMKATATFRDAALATVNTAVGDDVTVPAGAWTAVGVLGTSGAAVTNVVLSVEAVTGGSNWAIGDTLDAGAVLIEEETAFGTFFDGETPDGGGTVYAWTGTEEESTSTATIYQPVLTAVELTDAPCPRAEITIEDLDPGDNVVTVWRTADGKRRSVRGARRWTITGSDVAVDYEAPLGRTVTYELEILSGVSAQVVVPTDDVIVTSSSGWIQDPLDPSSSVPLYTDVGPGGEPSLTAEAVKRLEYAAQIQLIPILGQEDPVALIGQRMAGSSVPFHMMTDAAQQSTTLRDLLKQAAPVLVRPLPEWAQALPGQCYLAVEVIGELPVNEAWGGQIIEWELTSTLVSGPTFNIIVAVTTYGDVQELWDTYQSAQTTLSGDTYLDVKKSPSGA